MDIASSQHRATARRRCVLVVLGTRPEAIKLAPVIRALRDEPGFDTIVCSTAQHREMLDQALAAFDILPDVDLDLMRPGQHPNDLLGRMLVALDGVLAARRPEIVVVQGDTTTTAGGAIAAFGRGCSVAHVEAGLRTRDKRAPFPEEINRRLAGVVADWHFAPTQGARQALLCEDVSPDAIFLTGNTGIDAVRWMSDQVRDLPLPSEIDPGGRRLVLVTAHRRESFGPPFERICRALREIADRIEDALLLYPVHLNPNIRAAAQSALSGHPRIRLIEPLGYRDFVAAMRASALILTDSGGVQEEAPALGVPVLVLREKTERPEAVAAGAAQLVGTQSAAIVRAAVELLENPRARAAMARPLDVYGDGRAARRIVEVLADGRLTTPPFVPADPRAAVEIGTMPQKKETAGARS